MFHLTHGLKKKKIQIGIEKNICAFPNTPALPPPPPGI